MKVIKILYIVSLIFADSSFCEVITSPGEWKSEASETIYIQCVDTKINKEKLMCQMSASGPFYLLTCPEIKDVRVRLDQLSTSYFCYAQNEECKEPVACAILEKVVYDEGADFCRHGELSTERKCEEGFGYRFDQKIVKPEGKKIADQCCRNNEIFSRPGVSL